MEYSHHSRHNTGFSNYEAQNLPVKPGRPTLTGRLRGLHSVIKRKSCTRLHCWRRRTNWCGLSVEGALHSILSQRKTKQTSMTHCMATVQKARNFIALKPEHIFTYTTFQYLPTVNSASYTWTAVVCVGKEVFVFLSTHISFTVCLSRSIERTGIKMIYFTGHICFHYLSPNQPWQTC
jgi:hypothetical protein